MMVLININKLNLQTRVLREKFSIQHFSIQIRTTETKLNTIHSNPSTDLLHPASDGVHCTVLGGKLLP